MRRVHRGVLASVLILASCGGESTDSAGNPLAAAGTPSPDESRFEGVVQQRLRAGGYAYLEVAPPDGQSRWVATMGAGQAPGTSVRVRGMATRDDFHSRRLDRRFERLVFGIVEARSSAPLHPEG